MLLVKEELMDSLCNGHILCGVMCIYRQSVLGKAHTHTQTREEKTWQQQQQQQQVDGLVVVVVLVVGHRRWYKSVMLSCGFKERMHSTIRVV